MWERVLTASYHQKVTRNTVSLVGSFCFKRRGLRDSAYIHPGLVPKWMSIWNLHLSRLYGFEFNEGKKKSKFLLPPAIIWLYSFTLNKCNKCLTHSTSCYYLALQFYIKQIVWMFNFNSLLVNLSYSVKVTGVNRSHWRVYLLIDIASEGGGFLLITIAFAGGDLQLVLRS